MTAQELVSHNVGTDSRGPAALAKLGAVEGFSHPSLGATHTEEDFGLEPQSIDPDWPLAGIAVPKLFAVDEFQSVARAGKLLLLPGEAGQRHLLHLYRIHAAESAYGFIKLYGVSLIAR